MQEASFSFDNFELIVESSYGPCQEAIADLRRNRLATKEPGEIRRALFRYCQELVKGRKVEHSRRIYYEDVFVSSFKREFEDLSYFQLSLMRYLGKRDRSDGQKFVAKLKAILLEHNLPHYAGIVDMVLTQLEPS